MSGLSALLGDTLLSATGEVKTETALSGKKAVALYFSAHWCPPCRGFTPKLAEWYKANLQAKGLEVVFVSSDRDVDSFKEYFGEMPWLALPFEQRELKGKLSKKCKVDGIPSLAIVDMDGKVITTDGRSAVSSDPTGEKLPWRPKPLSEMLAAAKIVSQKGEESKFSDIAAQNKCIALYFSAHWCPPCKQFTPKFAEWYKEDLKGKGLEVVFVSRDRDEEAFKGYFGEMPWLALDFAQRDLAEELMTTFGLQGIPSVVILDKDLKLVTTDGRAAVSTDPKGEELPWHPKPVANLAGGPGNINDTPTVVALVESEEASSQKAAEAAMTPISQSYMDAAKKAEEDPEIGFMIATATGGISDAIRGMTGLSGSNTSRLALFDIPSDGAYYLAPEGTAITTENVEKFIADFRAGKLERKQLSKN